MYPGRTVDQLAKGIVIHIIEALDVQAALPGLVRAESRQRPPVPVRKLADQVDDQVLAAR